MRDLEPSGCDLGSAGDPELVHLVVRRQATCAPSTPRGQNQGGKLYRCDQIHSPEPTLKLPALLPAPPHRTPVT